MKLWWAVVGTLLGVWETVCEGKGCVFRGRGRSGVRSNIAQHQLASFRSAVLAQASHLEGSKRWLGTHKSL